MKKTGALLLSLLLTFTLGTGAAATSDTVRYQCGDFEYVLLDDGTAEITAYTNAAAGEISALTDPAIELTVPGALDGHAVRSLGTRMFYNCINLGSITLPEGLTNIGNQAFQYCIRLTGLNIPEGVTGIGDFAFSSCESITGLVIPDSVSHIGIAAFYQCISLKSLILPKSLRSIGDQLFQYCKSLSSLNIPQEVENIGVAAFYGCTSLLELNLPQSVKSIGKGAFYNCVSLTGLTIPEGITVIEDYTLQGCADLAGLNFPQSLKSIGEEALQGCVSLTDLIIPKDLTSIGNRAFADCPALTLTVISGSYAQEYAQKNGIPFVSREAPEEEETLSEFVHVADLAGLFTPQEAEGLEKAMNKLYEDFGFDSLILTTYDSQGMIARDYSIMFYELFRVSPEEYPDAVVFSIHMDLNEYYELTKGLGNTALTSQAAEVLDNLVLPYLIEGTFGEGMFAYLEHVHSSLDALSEGK